MGLPRRSAAENKQGLSRGDVIVYRDFSYDKSLSLTDCHLPLQVLHSFSQQQRRRSRPYKKRKKGTETYQSPKVKAALMLTIQEMSQDPSQMRAPAVGQPSAAPASAVEATKHDLFDAAPRPPMVGGATSAMNPHAMQHGQGIVGPVTSGPMSRALPALAGPVNFPHLVQTSSTNQDTPASAAVTAPPGMQGQQPISSLAPTSQTPSFPSGPQMPTDNQQPPSAAYPQPPLQHGQQLPPHALYRPQLPNANSNAQGVPKPNQTAAAGSQSVLEEGISIPKPRPPSPEYDDPEGKEVQEENSHLFRVSYTSKAVLSFPAIHFVYQSYITARSLKDHKNLLAKTSTHLWPYY